MSTFAKFVRQLHESVPAAIARRSSSGSSSSSSSSNSSYEMPNLCLVLGNEAADLDSLVGSLTYAAHLAGVFNNGSPGAETTTVLPLTNIPRADFTLRPECIHVLKSVGLSAESLLFLDDIVPFDQLARIYNLAENSNTHLEVCLVDHNNLAVNQQPHLSQFVSGIVDHHFDESQYLDRAFGPQKRIIEPVGSSTSLVLREIMKSGGQVDKVAARLMIETIMLDTMNLDPNAKRATQVDIDMVQVLKTILFTDDQNPDSPATVDSNGYKANLVKMYNATLAARNDISHLSNADLLRKDYKMWEVPDWGHVGISSVTMSLEDWLARGSSSPHTMNVIVSDLVARMESEKLRTNALMTSGVPANDSVFKRSLTLLFNKADAALAGEAISKLESNPDLDLERIPFDDSKHTQHIVRVYNQRNTTATRKKVFPALREALIASVSSNKS
ncbi:DHH phosphoesterase [Ramicandelaber brevisporus]|nr:DHH phosphoesterase [Ramicandelaber brevisporus]